MEGLERGSENQSPKQLQESDGFQVHVRLPTGETASFQAKRSSSVRDLKMIVEVNSGVPSDLFTLVNTQSDNNTIALEDDTNMAHMTTRANVDGSMTFELSIPPWWQRFVDRCMKRDNRQIIKRIAIKMNQISSEERAFVAAFIAAQKGDGQLFRSLMNGDVKIDVLQTVQCSGRTLLHAAVAGGNFSCAAAIFMNDGSSLLTKADHHGVTPVDMATNSNQPGLVQLLAKYVELKARESLQDEADVGKSSEEKGLQDSSANGENYQGGEGELVEGSEKDEEVSQNESKDNSAVVHDSDNRARPDQTREVGQTKENKDEMREGSSTARVPPQGMLNRGPNPQPKQHTPLRASKSLNTQNRPGSAKSKLVCVEEIRPLSCKAVPAVKQPEEKLPRVNTPPASPMNSPRMGRKLLPSLLTTDRPGSPILRPRSPALPCPRSPSSPRPKSPFMESPSGSPAFRRKVFRLASSPEPQRKRGISLHGGENEPQRARAMTYQAGDNGEARRRKMSYEMKEFLMPYYEPREHKPWNVWKTIRKNQLDQFDVSDDDDDADSSSEDENEKLACFLQTERSSRRKTFEMWLTDKEAALVRKQTLMAEKAKQEAMAKRKEANWRQSKGKTYEEWLEEKGEFREEEMLKGKPGEQTEARKAEALRKYQEWLRSKDEEALAREDQLRRQAAEKYSESKQKRDEKMQHAWFKKKLFNMF